MVSAHALTGSLPQAPTDSVPGQKRMSKRTIIPQSTEKSRGKLGQTCFYFYHSHPEKHVTSRRT